MCKMDIGREDFCITCSAGLNLANITLDLVSYNFRVQEYSALCERTGALASCEARASRSMSKQPKAPLTPGRENLERRLWRDPVAPDEL